MQNCWAPLLLLLGVATANPTKPTLLSFPDVLASAIAVYNRELGSGNAFRLLEAAQPQDWDPSSQTIQVMKFSLRETVCRADENPDVSQCDEKEDGVDRDCTGFYSAAENPPVIIVECEDVDQEMDRITRSRWRRFWRKTKNFVKQHGVGIALGALRLRG